MISWILRKQTNDNSNKKDNLLCVEYDRRSIWGAKLVLRIHGPHTFKFWYKSSVSFFSHEYGYLDGFWDLQHSHTLYINERIKLNSDNSIVNDWFKLM